MFAAMLALAAILSVSMRSSSALSDSDRGTWLFEACKGAVRWMDAPTNRPDAENESFFMCASYIGGFLDAESLFTNCIAPDSATLGTFIRVYIQYMTAHPKLLDEHKAVGLQSAYLDAYPCKSLKGPSKSKRLRLSQEPENMAAWNSKLSE